MFIERALMAVGVSALVLVIVWAYVAAGGKLLDLARTSVSRRLTPWLFLGPAMFVVGVVLIYPMVATLVMTFFNAKGFAGLSNYTAAFSDPDTSVALRNTLLWVVTLPLSATFIGLCIATMTDRVKYGSAVKLVLFVPVAISAVATAVMWKFMYDYRPPGHPQTGTLNAILNLFDQGPRAWLLDGNLNNAAIIATVVWTEAGFAMVIFAAALRAIPTELYEAAELDGAGPIRQFIHITVPTITPIIVVVATTMVVFALKAFDVVYVMTNGASNTDILGTLMYKQLFSARDSGRAAVLATALVLMVTPIMALNIRQYRRDLRGASL